MRLRDGPASPDQLSSILSVTCVPAPKDRRLLRLFLGLQEAKEPRMILAGRPESRDGGMGPPVDDEPLGHAGQEATVSRPGHGPAMMSWPRRPGLKGAEGHGIVACSDAAYKEPVTAPCP